MGSSISDALDSEDDKRNTVTITSNFNEKYTLNKFKTSFKVNLGFTHILVEVTKRGASQILVAYNAGMNQPTITADSNSSNEILLITTTYLDESAAVRVEDVHLIKKENNQPG